MLLNRYFTCVSIKADSSMKTFAMFQNVQSQQNFWTFTFFLNAVQSPFQI